MAPAEGAMPEIVHSVDLICERKGKEPMTNVLPDTSSLLFCNKSGFNITIPRKVTDPPLNLDAVGVASHQGPNCKPQRRSAEAVTFSFPFTDCGTQSTIADGNITYWTNIEVKQHPHKGVIFRHTPFHLTVRCTFALTQMTQVGITVHQSASEYPSTLMNKGMLRTQMRFAKDSSYRSFHSSTDPPVVSELGQPVYVEVLVKHDDKDLELLLEDCWATPTEDPDHPLRWNLLFKGCPFTGDSHRTVVLPVSSKDIAYPALHKWFAIKMFSFVRFQAFENLVFLHCNVEICKGPNCLHHCSNGKRHQRISPEMEQSILPSVVSSGPLLYYL
ncbi:zona pellucida sperm-binding protein 4-like isoform 2-T3 [Menidia menidia]